MSSEECRRDAAERFDAATRNRAGIVACLRAVGERRRIPRDSVQGKNRPQQRYA